MFNVCNSKLIYKMNNINDIDLLYSQGIIYLGNFKDLAFKLKNNYLDNQNSNCDYIDSSERDFTRHCKLPLDNKDILGFLNSLEILKKLNKKNYLFRNKIDLIRWRSRSEKSGAFFYHSDGMENQISLMMLLSENKNSSKMFFAKNTKKSFFLKFNNIFTGDKFKSSIFNKILKNIFLLFAPIFNILVEKKYNIEKLSGDPGDCYIFNAGNFLHKANPIKGSTRDIMHFNLTLNKSKVIENHKLNFDTFDQDLRPMIEVIGK